MHKHKVKTVEPDSIAEEMEIEPGDLVLAINDEEIKDVFDYRYLINDEFIVVTVEKPDGDVWDLEIEKDYNEDLGIEFENSMMDDYRSCHNKCIFCFIDQMPPGMRETLYFKDDDSRLSFLQGNYITLTNMKEADINRIITYHLDPINISIQSMNPKLRCKLLNNRFAGDALKHLPRLKEAGITMNGQIVLCKGVNDKEELEYSIAELTKLLPQMQSVSVVPAGLTKYREGLFPLEPFTQEEAGAVIDQIERWQKKIYEEHGIHFIHASDEWYILAKRDFPEEERYDGYLQLENGVGMMRLLYNEFTEALAQVEKSIPVKEETISIATGQLAYGLMAKFAKLVMEQFPQVTIHVYKIVNDFFGHTITVSGLITGQDLLAQLKEKPLGSRLILSSNMIRSGETVFLDDITVEQVENTLQTKVNIVESNGKALLDCMLNRYKPQNENHDNFVYIKAYPDHFES